MSTVSEGVPVRRQGGWMESRRTMSNEGAFEAGQSRYHPHCSQYIESNDFMIPSVSMKSSLCLSKKLTKKGGDLEIALEGKMIYLKYRYKTRCNASLNKYCLSIVLFLFTLFSTANSRKNVVFHNDMRIYSI